MKITSFQDLKCRLEACANSPLAPRLRRTLQRISTVVPGAESVQAGTEP